MRRKGFFTASLALFFCLLAVPDLYAAWSSSIRGRVKESGSGQSLAGVKVRLVYALSGKELASTLTDINGKYQLGGLKLPTNKRRYFIKLSKAGYTPKSAGYYFTGLLPYVLNFELRPALAPAPILVSLTPSDGAVFLAGSHVEVKASGPGPANGPPVEYCFSIGGTIVQPWSTSNTYIWQTRSSDKGRVEISCQVRNSPANPNYRNISVSIIDPTAEEALQKVADNYAKIQDFKADMVLSSTLDGRPFGQTEYCRYYFKAPNKEKTEAYTDSSRATLKEVMITDGPKLIMVDPANNLKQEVDLLQETGLTSAQFNQMDLYYDQGVFLVNHTVNKNNNRTDFNNFVITLDARPNQPNRLYSKLELYVDYNKGVLVKSCLYKEDKLIQTIEVAGIEQINNGSWFSNSMRKIYILRSGILIDTASYSNTQINLGLEDVEFQSN